MTMAMAIGGVLFMHDEGPALLIIGFAPKTP